MESLGDQPRDVVRLTLGRPARHGARVLRRPCAPCLNRRRRGRLLGLATRPAAAPTRDRQVQAGTETRAWSSRQLLSINRYAVGIVTRRPDRIDRSSDLFIPPAARIAQAVCHSGSGHAACCSISAAAARAARAAGLPGPSSGRSADTCSALNGNRPSTIRAISSARSQAASDDRQPCKGAPAYLGSLTAPPCQGVCCLSGRNVTSDSVLSRSRQSIRGLEQRAPLDLDGRRIKRPNAPARRVQGDHHECVDHGTLPVEAVAVPHRAHVGRPGDVAQHVYPTGVGEPASCRQAIPTDSPWK